MLVNLCTFVLVLVVSSFTSSLGCPSGCVCRGRPEQRDTAVCYRAWRSRTNVRFTEPITSMEFRHMSFEDMRPFLAPLRNALTTLVIYPARKSASDNPLAADIFNGMDALEALTIHPTANRQTPVGLARALAPLTDLKTLDLVGNSLTCDCTLPDMLASKHVLLLGKSRMYPIRNCQGFEESQYSINQFLEECAKRGNYELQGHAEDSAADQPQTGGNRYFGNARDATGFKTGVQYTRINSNLNSPSRANAAPNSFAGILGPSGSGALSGRRVGPLLPGTKTRAPPPNVNFAHIINRARGRRPTRRQGRSTLRRLLGLEPTDEELGRNGTESRFTEEGMDGSSSFSYEESDTSLVFAQNGDPTSNDVVSGGMQNNRAVSNQPIGLSQPENAAERQQHVQRKNGQNHNGGTPSSTGANEQHSKGNQANAHLARQLAVYQLPINDLTIRLNPFDPVEVDLFFQYILHEGNLPRSQRSSRP